ncbi:adenylyl-sulfate kinase [Priestia megaterium]|uniref:adenylyl-sulfate kinase n=1 Tax=Priestia megaterium TaxID=1404 RepID=UPI003A87062C
MTEKKKADNITWHESKVNKNDRRKLNKHTSAVLWFTGLSGSGKSTLAVEVERKLNERGIHTYILDGDNIRHGLNKDLGFSPEDRSENIRRIGEVTKLFVDAGIMTLTAFISPYHEERQQVRELLNDLEFIEIYVKCSLEAAEIRDPKGLYKKARNGEIKNFTGIDAPYEAPKHPELIVETDQLSLEDSVKQVIEFLERKGYIYL